MVLRSSPRAGPDLATPLPPKRGRGHPREPFRLHDGLRWYRCSRKGVHDGTEPEACFLARTHHLMREKHINDIACSPTRGRLTVVHDSHASERADLVSAGVKFDADSHRG
jgi:hypothetical protein